MRRCKRIITIIILAALLLFSGCEADIGMRSEERTDEFIAALENMDFEKAYSYLWKYSGCPSKEAFVSDCKYVVDALSVSGITITDAKEETNAYNVRELSYTCLLRSDTAGDIVSECLTDVVTFENKTYFTYTRSLLLSDFGESDMIVSSSLTGKRGEIITSDGETVAENNFADTVYVAPSSVKDFDEVIKKLSGIIELSEKDIDKAEKSFKTAVEKNYGVSVIAAYPHNSIDEQTESLLTQIDGVKVDRTSITSQRYYPYKNVFSHVIGYANTPNTEEQLAIIDNGGYSASSVFGKEGIEKSYNETLMGKDGKRIAITDENYFVKRVLYEKPADDGSDIIVTLNADLQQRAYYALHDNLSTEQTGVAIVLDYKTGAVLAQTALTSYDPNLFSYSISTEDYQAMFEAEGADQPLFSRATSGLYPPGSVIKPFIAGFALDDGTITENTEFPYSIDNNKWTPEGWQGKSVTRSYDSGTPLKMYNALVMSDNIFFSWVGMKLGKDKLFSDLSGIGFGKAFDYDLPVSTSNIVYEDTVVLEYIVADTAIGHGEVLITPIQIASLYTTFTNGGSSLSPYLIEKIYDTDTDGKYNPVYTASTNVEIENVMSEDSVKKIKNALHGVVTDGTARSLNSENKTVYAKTGTAIKRQGTDERISWVCAWSEGGENDRLVVVMIDGPNGQDTVKFNIAKELLK